MFEICLTIYLMIGLALTWGMRVDDDRRLLAAKPFGALIIAVSWPAVIVMLIPKVKIFKFRGKTLWERKS